MIARLKKYSIIAISILALYGIFKILSIDAVNSVLIILLYRTVLDQQKTNNKFLKLMHENNVSNQRELETEIKRTKDTLISKIAKVYSDIAEEIVSIGGKK